MFGKGKVPTEKGPVVFGLETFVMDGPCAMAFGTFDTLTLLPVGLSSNAFRPVASDSNAFSIIVSWQSYALCGNCTWYVTPATVRGYVVCVLIAETGQCTTDGARKTERHGPPRPTSTQRQRGPENLRAPSL